jgi:integrase/recombinase XerD
VAEFYRDKSGDRTVMAPVEYAVAVDRYLATIALAERSRRVYRIALGTWAWSLVGRIPPTGPDRLGAAVPVVSLTLLDEPAVAERLATGLATRAATGSARTASRELSILRGAVAWWRVQGWIRHDPTAGLRAPSIATGRRTTLDAERLRALRGLRVGLREQVCWRLITESGAPAARVLALDVTDVDPGAGRVRLRDEAGNATWHRLRPATAQLAAWLIAGRAGGPLFLTDRRAPAGTSQRDRCPVTGRARLSYRRAAELFAAATRDLDPAGRGWTLRQLRRA